MPPARPFIDSQTDGVDVGQLLTEAIPLTKLVAAVVAVALVPFALAFASGTSIVGVIYSLLGQFVLAVGSGLVLMYVISRGIELANDR